MAFFLRELGGRRSLAHPKVAAAVKTRLREQYRTLDPVALLAEIRAVQEELGNRVDRRAEDARRQERAGKSTAPQPVQSSSLDAVAFAKTLGATAEAGRREGLWAGRLATNSLRLSKIVILRF